MASHGASIDEYMGIGYDEATKANRREDAGMYLIRMAMDMLLFRQMYFWQIVFAILGIIVIGILLEKVLSRIQ